MTTIEESHTSKCSFLDNEPIQQHNRYLGKRVKRDVFVASDGQPAACRHQCLYNILRRYALQVMTQGNQRNQGVGACVLRPQRLRLLDRRQDRSKQRPRRKAAA